MYTVTAINHTVTYMKFIAVLEDYRYLCFLVFMYSLQSYYSSEKTKKNVKMIITAH